VRGGTILDHVQYVSVHSGDTVFMPAGTVHALGPGLLVYEVQENSDITYRVFDWNRPQTAGRVLHIEQSLAVANPGATGQARPLPPLQDGAGHLLCACPYFTLEMLYARRSASIELDTAGESFHALTVIEGALQVVTEGETIQVGRFETIFVPASYGGYRLQPHGGFRALKASVEG
jgi:mannose-6-phosphate isomerase